MRKEAISRIVLVGAALAVVWLSASGARPRTIAATASVQQSGQQGGVKNPY